MSQSNQIGSGHPPAPLWSQLPGQFGAAEIEFTDHGRVAYLGGQGKTRGQPSH
ncbi:hypothetical protein [Shewanella algae]|uniref:hypothetical protein n=1 Tax=Shewanella algae TaxID=38313 RepID=UPI0016424614|nr:hypothetical protein [Shewanella algae]